jgi:hypothetical protein
MFGVPLRVVGPAALRDAARELAGRYAAGADPAADPA